MIQTENYYFFHLQEWPAEEETHEAPGLSNVGHEAVIPELLCDDHLGGEMNH